MTTRETSSYIKGLMDGLDLNRNTPEGKLIAALVDLCGEMAAEIETLRDELDVCNQYIEEIDEDLGAVEDLVYGDDPCGCPECDDECDCCDDEDEDDEDEDGAELYCAQCPSCGGKVYFDDSVNPEDVICPACQKPLVTDEDEE